MFQRVQLGDIVLGTSYNDQFVVTDVKLGGKPDTTDGDQPRPRDDGEFFGRDRLRGRLITIEGFVNDISAEPCLDAWGRLLRAWDAPGVRQFPGTVTPLTVEAFGRTPATVFGRPRAIDPVDDQMIYVEAGRIDFVATFQCIDYLFYGPEKSNGVGIVGAGISGTTWPLQWPLRWSLTTASAPGTVQVEGDADAYFSAVVHGPITRPVVAAVELFDVELDMTLADDRFVTVSTYPWERGVWLDGSIPMPGAVTVRSRRLSKARLPPGPQEVVLRGTDPSGTASMLLSWRDAKRSI